MARRSAALRIVEEEVEEPKGDPTLTLEAISMWKEGQRRCRARKRHNWGPLTVREHRDFYEVVERCTHCGNRRSAEFNKRGHKLSDWSPDYRDNYLLPKGARRLDEDLHDELMLADILSRRIVEVLDDDD